MNDHTYIIRWLLSSLYEVNERIMTGDYVSPKFAIGSSMVRKMLLHSHDQLSEAGCTDVSLQLFTSAGGWVGLQYHYVIDGADISCSVVPRRV